MPGEGVDGRGRVGSPTDSRLRIEYLDAERLLPVLFEKEPERAVPKIRARRWNGPTCARETYEASLDTLDRARQLAHRLFNVWIDEHDRGALAGCPLVLVMDLFEHAYLTDYGTKRADYIDAFLAAADWEEAGRRFEAAQAPVPDVVRA